MKISVRKIALGVLLVGAFVLAACGGSASGDGASGGLTVGSDGENLAYAPVTLTAKAGEKVSLVFKNNSTALAHNFVLVNGGVDVANAVNDAGGEAGEAAGYVAADKADVIAHSALLAPGASETLEFTAPAAGTYSYICTYPAHLGGGMIGTLTVN
jgi:plastocyanin